MSYKEYLNYLLDVFEEIINDIKEIKETYNSNNDILNKKKLQITTMATILLV